MGTSLTRRWRPSVVAESERSTLSTSGWSSTSPSSSATLPRWIPSSERIRSAYWVSRTALSRISAANSRTSSGPLVPSRSIWAKPWMPKSGVFSSWETVRTTEA